MSYFKVFPQITFKGKSVADITRKVKLSSIVKSEALDYMDYTVQEGEKPEDVANFYYDDPSLAWLVLLANDIIDPYTQWPKSQENLEKYIIAQYESQSGTTGRQVIDWAKNATIASNIVMYQSQFEEDIRVNRATFIQLGKSTIITADKMIYGEQYIFKSAGEVSTSQWQVITGDVDFTLEDGNIFTAQVNGTAISASDTAKVSGSSSTNPAREFIPLRAYDYEFELNEERRQISLLNKGYLGQIKDQLETILKDV